MRFYSDAHSLQTPTCNCGSGLIPHWEFDGNGIELFKACGECVNGKMSQYRRDIVSIPYGKNMVDDQIEDNY